MHGTLIEEPPAPAQRRRRRAGEPRKYSTRWVVALRAEEFRAEMRERWGATTQGEMAAVLGCAQHTVSRIIRHEQQPGTGFIGAVQAAGISLDRVFTSAEVKQP